MAFTVRSWPNHRKVFFTGETVDACKAYIFEQAMHPWMWIEDAQGVTLYEGHTDCKGRGLQTEVVEKDEPVVEKAPRKPRKVKAPVVVVDPERIAALAWAVCEAKHNYYCLGTPILNDFDYDLIEAELKTLDPTNPALGVGCVTCGGNADAPDNLQADS